MMSYERLEVYQLAIQFLSLARSVRRALPRGEADLDDQLKRASRSMPLNIAEGAGKSTQRHQAQYWQTARGSAMECGSVLDVLKNEGLIDEQLFNEGKSVLERIVAMLTKLCR